MGERDTALRNGRHVTWSQSGTLITGNKAGVVSLQTGDLSDLDYKYYTIQFGVIPPNVSPLTNAGYQALATITWSVNGNPITRQVSVGQGIEISGPADSITVRVQDATPTPGFAPAGSVYTVTISCSPGTRAATAQNQPLLYPTPTVQTSGSSAPAQLGVNGSASDTATFNVPQGAGVTGYWVSVAASITISPNLDVQQMAGATLFEHIFAQLNPLFVPLAPGANQVVIQNLDTQHGASVSFMWTIDG